MRTTAAAVFGLAAIVLVGIIVLLGIGKTVPTELWGIGVALVSGGLGITVPTAITSSTTTPGAIAPPTPGAPTP